MSKYSEEPIGTQIAGYAGPEKAPFKCANCIHYHVTRDGAVEHTCDHPVVKKDADAGNIKKTEDGKPVISPQGCCTYFR
jgi:hypothetical protein